MQIASGLFPHMVLQRNTQNVSQARVAGTCRVTDSAHLLLPPAFTEPQALTEPHTLSYGFGTNSYCNITDGADRSLPVFGPLPIL